MRERIDPDPLWLKLFALSYMAVIVISLAIGIARLVHLI